jgi:hypothetical protein
VDVKIAEPILYANPLKISCITADCMSGTQSLSNFQNAEVSNLILPHKVIPGKVEAEDFSVNNGFSFETCTDAGAGTNTSYAAVDKYLDYYAWVENSGTYKLDFRISVNAASAQIAVLKDVNGAMVPAKSVLFSNTGGWQNWQTQSSTVLLSAGKNIIRLLSRTDGYNLNWIELTQVTALQNNELAKAEIYPNPVQSTFFLKFNNAEKRTVELCDLQGKLILKAQTTQALEQLNISHLQIGVYLIRITELNQQSHYKLLKNN